MRGIELFWSQFFSWLPPSLYSAFIAFVLVLLLIVAFKIVAFIMDVIPFI